MNVTPLEGSKTVFKSKQSSTCTNRNDLIYFDETGEDEKELIKGFKIGQLATTQQKEQVLSLVKKYWDCFCKRGAKRTILEYEFGVDTGASQPVACRVKQYGPHESKIMMEQVEGLLANDWIEETKGAWGSIIVLAPKPHQEHIEDIDDFIWRMCVSYRGLNRVTKPFAYPIPRCNDAIGSLNLGPGTIFIITVDARQGYHQVKVKEGDKDKLAFFAPNGKKYTYKVMPFGPMNAPAFYTFMMQKFREEWDELFYTTLHDMTTIEGKIVTVTATNEVRLDGLLTQTGSKGIIDDILIWSTHQELVLTYFECVCKIFQKYRVSFRLDKCEFLKDRVEYVGHDLTPAGNCPAMSKFDMINDWNLPETGQSLHSFVGLVNFYHNYVPYFEMRIKPLRSLHRKFNRQPIPKEAWTPELIALFEDLKVSITSSPVLTRYDPSQSVFLKTDWSAEGMAWILMQPAGDKQSQSAAETLRKTGECTFDKTKTGARLLPISYGSRACTEIEKHYHSFVGEVAAGRWGISQNRKSLWGAHFYWLCDCSAVKEILEYEGTIHTVMRWAQELLGYHFTVIHRPATMMADVDALTRRFGKDIATYITIAAIFERQSKKYNPTAYDTSAFSKTSKSTRIEAPTTPPLCPILTNKHIQNQGRKESKTEPACIANPDIITSTPVLTYSAAINLSSRTQHTSQSIPRPCETALMQNVIWTTINDVAGSVQHWVTHMGPPHINWQITNFITDQELTRFNDNIQGDIKHSVNSVRTILSKPDTHKSHIIDITFTPKTNGSIYNWIDHILHHIIRAPSPITTRLVNLWVSPAHISKDTAETVTQCLNKELSNQWRNTTKKYSFTSAGLAIHSFRYCYHMQYTTDVTNLSTTPRNIHMTDQLPTVKDYIDTSLNTDSNACPIIIPNEAMKSTQYSSTHPIEIASIQPISDLTTAAGYSSVLSPDGLAVEPDPTTYNDFTKHRFAIPFQNSTNTWTARRVSDAELLAMYGFQNCTSHFSPTDYLESTLDENLVTCIPHQLLFHILEHDSPWNNVFEHFALSDDETINTMQCLTISAKPAPHTLDWTAAYGEDPDTAAIAQLMLDYGHSKTWSTEHLSTINKAYHDSLKTGHIQHMRGKFIFYKSIQANARYIGLIIVPRSLRKPLFSHYHAGPSGGHMGEYKTLYRMRSRFFWPKMREDIKAWVKGCAHCQSYNTWRNRRSELYFSWPVTSPFWIMHVDLWSPGHITQTNGKKGYLLNAMCDLTQFVVSTPTTDISSANLAQIYMENVIFNFGTSAIIVVDDGSTFKGVFQEMCKHLKLTYWALSKGNHKGMSVERYHRFLNKTQAITGNDRGTHLTYLQNAKTSQYAWNSAPIDNTDIPRSLAAIGRELRFPLDVELCPTPPLNDEHNTALMQYLRDVSNDSKFSIAVLQILIEERRTAHRDRHNQQCKTAPFKVGDVVKAHVQVQSKSSIGQVGKLSYKARGPFQIIEDLGHGSYLVQRYNEPTASKRKYKATELYLLPPALFPADPLDTTYQRYLNYEHAPLQHPLQQALQIDLYNTKYLQPPLAQLQGDQRNQFTQPVDAQALSSPHIPTNSELHQETNTTPEKYEITDEASQEDTTNRLTSIQQSSDKLFFIKYTTEGTMRPKWYLIQVDMDATLEANPRVRTTGIYYCTFLARHPNDKTKNDEYSRFWPDWYEYTKHKITGIIQYGKRILFPPHQTPNPDKYIQWADEIDLHTNDNVLLGPFNFEPISPANRTRYKVHHNHWDLCYQQCIEQNITPPSISSQVHQQPLPHRRRTKSQQKRKHS